MILPLKLSTPFKAYKKVLLTDKKSSRSFHNVYLVAPVSNESSGFLDEDSNASSYIVYAPINIIPALSEEKKLVALPWNTKAQFKKTLSTAARHYEITY